MVVGSRTDALTVATMLGRATLRLDAGQQTLAIVGIAEGWRTGAGLECGVDGRGLPLLLLSSRPSASPPAALAAFTAARGCRC